MARKPLQIDLETLAPDTSEAKLEKLIKKILTGKFADTTRKTLALDENPHHRVLRKEIRATRGKLDRARQIERSDNVARILCGTQQHIAAPAANRERNVCEADRHKPPPREGRTAAHGLAVSWPFGCTEARQRARIIRCALPLDEQ